MLMKIGVIFGSRSVEHDVSITSAYAIMKWLEKMGTHEIFPLYITRTGKWIYDKKFIDINTFKDYKDEDYKDTHLKIDFSSSKKLSFEQEKNWIFGKKEKIELDFIFPILHGMNGEDGSIQWLLDILQVPYMWPSVLGSAVGMNKIIMKNVFKSLWLPITDYMVFDKKNYDEEKVINSFSFPLMVKPANLGSSIWITKVDKKEDLADAVELAFYYDKNIIIETCVQNLIELNCSVSEKNSEIITSLVEQPIASSDFLSFEEKYVSNDGGTMQGVKDRVKIPAPIDDHLTKQIQDYSKTIYKELFCYGGAPRIDYLYDKENKKLFVNEINTIPWALQMHLWVKSMSVWDFLSNLIEVWIKTTKEKEINIDFQSNIIGHTINFSK